MTDSSSPQVNRRSERLLPKLASLAIRHADLLVATSCLFGLIALLLLPSLAKNTYISENALIPGSASPKFTVRDAMDAAQFARDLQASKHNTTNPGMAIRSFLVKYLVNMGADFYVHPFYPPDSTFASINFLSSHPSFMKRMQSSDEHDLIDPETFGVNVAGILRAPRGEGNEAIVLVTPYDAKLLTDVDAFTLGLGLSLFQLLSNAPWLAKDIVWLVADSHYSLHSAVSAWLKDYHEPFFLGGPNLQSPSSHPDFFSRILDKASVSLLEETTLGDFKRAGVIGAGVVFKMQGVQGRLLSDFLTVYAEGPNGQMPNLDLINVVNNLAVYREGLQTRVDMAANMLEWAWLHIAGKVLEKVGQVAAMLNAGWKFGLPAFDYVQGAATLTRSVILQALGVPTGAHGAFRDYQIDAVTVILSFASQAQGGQVGSLLKFGRLLEGTIRSVNNLLEKFHQSFFLYFLSGPSRFVSVGVYTIPLLLLLITLPLKAAALCSQSSGSSESSSEGSSQLQAGPVAAFEDGKLVNWLFAVFLVCVFELWAFVVAIFPLVANHLAELSDMKVAVWIAYAIISCFLAFISLLWISRAMGISSSIGSNWTAIKASTLGVATIGVGIMSIINFAAALAGAVVLVPVCLTVRPLRKQKGIYQFLTGLAWSVCFALLFSLFFGEEPRLSLGVFWEWVECQWKWGSATYLYLSLVHLPCLVLCLMLLVCNPDK